MIVASVLLLVLFNTAGQGSACLSSCNGCPNRPCEGMGPTAMCVPCCDHFDDTACLQEEGVSIDGLTAEEENNTQFSTRRGYGLFADDEQTINQSLTFLSGYCYFCAILDLEEAVTGLYIALNENGTSTCQHNSHGLLCAYCNHGYYRNLGGECVCNSSTIVRDWFLYILTQFVPITVWFFALLFSGHSLVGGALNSAIFFAQMVTTTMDLDGDGFIPISNLTKDNSKIAYGVESVYHLLYEPFNLNFGYPFAEKLCLLKVSTYLPYLAIQYIVAFYPLILISIVLFIVWLYNRNVTIIEKFRMHFYGCLQRIPAHLPRSIRDVFASFILLSYQKFIFISAMLLNPNRLIRRNGDTDRYVMFYDPSVNFFKNNHITFAVIAVLIYMFALALPILLTIICHNKKRQKCKWVNFFVEPFQKHYRKRCNDGECCKHHRYRLHDSRWVAGLYFFLRLIFITIFILAPSTYRFIVQFVLQQLACIIAAMFFFMYEPYRKKWHNKLDAFFLLLLAFINTLSIYQYFLTTDGKQLSVLAFVMQYILIFIPFLWMITVGVYKVVQMCRNRRHGRDSTDNGENGDSTDISDDDSVARMQDSDLTRPPVEDTPRLNSTSVHLVPSSTSYGATSSRLRSGGSRYGRNATSNPDTN